MPIMNDDVAEDVRRYLLDLPDPVRLVMCSEAPMEATWSDTCSLIAEVAGLSEKLLFEVYDCVDHIKKNKRLEISRTPALAILGKKDYGIRLYGTPTGYLFAPFIQTIRMVSYEETGLSDETLQILANIKTPVQIQVFTRNT